MTRFLSNRIHRRNAVLDLCGGTGSWSAPWRDLGYEVYVVDTDPILEPDFCMSVQTFLKRLVQEDIFMPPIDVVLMAPPCTHFTNASSRLWEVYDQRGDTRQALEILDACLKIKDIVQPRVWALENPLGRLATLRPHLAPARWSFQPYHYGDPWKKETWIWGNASKPAPINIVDPMTISPNARHGGKGAKVKTERSRTPQGFARAFAAVNTRKREHQWL